MQLVEKRGMNPVKNVNGIVQFGEEMGLNLKTGQVQTN